MYWRLGEKHAGQPIQFLRIAAISCTSLFPYWYKSNILEYYIIANRTESFESGVLVSNKPDVFKSLNHRSLSILDLAGDFF